jgi:hypothetical protein
MLDQGEIGLVGGMYDLSTGEVRFFNQAMTGVDLYSPQNKMQN